MQALLFLCASFAFANSMIMCPDDICKTMKCDTALTAESCSANGGSLKEKGGFCGCCDMCVQQLAEGDDCTSSMLLGAPQTAECAEGLYCNFAIRRCQPKTCAMIKKEREEMSGTLLGMTIPECDEDGNYAGKQCSGSQCYCVDNSGKNLGYSHNRWETSEDIACQCARDKAEYMAKGIVGKLFHCTEVGDYEGVQCHGSVCYCADKKTGKSVGTSGVHISAIGSLNC